MLANIQFDRGTKGESGIAWLENSYRENSAKTLWRRNMMLRSARLPSWAASVLWTIALFVIFGVFPLPVMAAASDPPEAFVQQSIDKGYVILNDPSLSDNQRHAQFRNFMLAAIDVKRIGLFALGGYANGASKTDIEAFTNAFIDYAVAVYESRLSKYKGQTLKVTGAIVRAADDVVVDADLVNPNASANATPIKAAFRVRNMSDGKPVITDIQIEGIWLALSQRSDFTGFLQQHGGRLSVLTDNLRMQMERLRADNPN
jgi:phospholipid transport system substrate-binding protein